MGWQDFFSDVDPSRIAIVYDEEPITFARLGEDVSDAATWMAGQGLSAGQIAGIHLRHRYWTWVAHLAAMRLGLTVASLTRNFSKETAAVPGIEVLIGDESLMRFGSKQSVLFEPENMVPLREQFTITDKPPPVESETPCSARRLALTSGTTGTPKAVLWNEDVLERRIEAVRMSQGLESRTVLMTFLWVDSTPGFRYPLATWGAGGCVVLRPEGATEVPAKTNFIVTSPQRLHSLVSNLRGQWIGRDQRKIVVTGGRLPIPLRDAALKLASASISIAYGATETGSIATGDARLLDRHPGAVGFAVPGATVEIVDSEGNRKRAGEAGIVRTRTPYMAHRYEGNSVDVAVSPFRDGWFYPGDEGILFADGLLAITGRRSETLNLSGLKVSAPDLEAKLSQLPFVREICVVMTREGPVDMMTLVAVCDDAVKLDVLKKRIRSEIPGSTPFRLVRVREIPRNSMGKIARPELEKWLKQVLNHQP